MRIVLISILLMGTSFVYGQSNNTVAAQNAVFYKNTHSSVLSDREQNIIFGSNVNVVLLDNDEMKHTQGEFWPLLINIGIGLAISGISWLNAPGPNDHIYTEANHHFIGNFVD
ncbi:hypothetical protein [Helicobacter sp. 11S03491-1]|uniref:hypothetical protein n=1 Tax=Helicobacter sp. 11S03491-1 TaxID=1476196 RepID=UPI000BA64CD4|nr:hypothetical protein [Helicobacter sp. 11S03491-1]PAF42018.1 hypothetical protein BKH45_05410 [Helicobacter sp. 11S03491-1]